MVVVAQLRLQLLQEEGGRAGGHFAANEVNHLSDHFKVFLSVTPHPSTETGRACISNGSHPPDGGPRGWPEAPGPGALTHAAGVRLRRARGQHGRGLRRLRAGVAGPWRRQGQPAVLHRGALGQPRAGPGRQRAQGGGRPGGFWGAGGPLLQLPVLVLVAVCCGGELGAGEVAGKLRADE